MENSLFEFDTRQLKRDFKDMVFNIGGKKLPVEFGPETDYQPLFRVNDVLELFNYGKSMKSKIIEEATSALGVSTISGQDKLCFKLVKDGLNTLLNIEDIAVFLPFIPNKAARAYSSDMIRLLFNMLKRKDKWVESRLIGNEFNFNRLETHRVLKNQGYDDAAITIRNEIKDLENQLKDEYHINWSKAPVKWSNLLRSLNYSLIGESKINRDTASLEVLKKIKKIYNSVLLKIQLYKIENETETIPTMEFEIEFSKALKKL